MTLAETRRLLRADREQLRRHLELSGLPATRPAFTASYLCVALYRHSRWCHVRGWNRAARLLWQLNVHLTAADISPLCDLGEGLVIVHPVAVTMSGSAGRGLVVEGWGGFGGGLARADIGAGPGLPLMGDDVYLGHGAIVLGPVRIGHGVRIGPGCTVVRDVPDGCEVEPPAIRVRSGTDAGPGNAAA